MEGVLITPLKRILHPKGDVLHGMKRSDAGYKGFGEAYFSTVHAGEIKAWKKHLRMTLNLVVPLGCIRFYLYDDRLESPSKGQGLRIELGEDHYARLTVPPGVWLAFEGLDPSVNLLLNVADMEHDPMEVERAEIDAFPLN